MLTHLLGLRPSCPSWHGWTLLTLHVPSNAPSSESSSLPPQLGQQLQVTLYHTVALSTRNCFLHTQVYPRTEASGARGLCPVYLSLQGGAYLAHRRCFAKSW